MIPAPELPPITLLSLLHFCWAIGWALLVFAAIAGYGGLLLRAFRFNRPPLALAATAGFAPVILLGGLLNFAGLILPGVLIGFVLVGVGLAIATLRPGPVTLRPWNTTAKVLLGAVVLAGGVRVASTVHSAYYFQADDLMFYLAAPVKMLETHSYAADPFSERRITSSIGGSEFLSVLILATQPVECMQMSDWALGAFLLLALGFAIGAEFELTAAQACGFTLLLMLMPQIRLNISPTILPSALFLGMVYCAAHRRLTADFPWLQAIVLGGLVGANAALKSTYLPHGVMFIACLAALRLWKRGWPAAMRLVLVAAICCGVTMLPWMIANLHTSGTMFYPLLGKGFHYSAYGMYPAPTSHDMGVFLRRVVPPAVLVLGMLLFELYASDKEERSYTAIALTLAAFLATLLLGFSTGGDSVKRYNFPCILPALCLVFVVAARSRNAFPALRSRVILGVTSLAILAVALQVGLSSFPGEYAHTFASLRTGLSDYRIINASMRAEYDAIGRAIPSGGVAIETVAAPFLFDFGAHDILMADFQGAASPKPGWPARQSGEALAQFLLSQHVRYLIFGYGECGDHPANMTCLQVTDFYNKPNANMSQWVVSEAMTQHDASVQYLELAKTRKHLYDDGHVFVLDLASPASR